MSATEHALTIDHAGRRLVAVLAASTCPSEVGVVVIVGGPQYRVGAHRQFVVLARRLAAAGYPTLRFDASGMGDSEGEPASFEQMSPDIGAAIDALFANAPTVRRVVLWGLCDGASAALLYVGATNDARVRGLCLLNPWVRSEQTLAAVRVRHYYVDRVRDPAFWRKLFGGGVARSALIDAWRSVRAMGRSKATAVSGADGNAVAHYTERMARGWHGFDGALLLLLSGSDYTAREFVTAATTQAAWRGALQRHGLRRVDVADADHTFSGPGSAEQADAELIAWLAQEFGAAHPTRGA